jgi:hypothetical protein
MYIFVSEYYTIMKHGCTGHLSPERGTSGVLKLKQEIAYCLSNKLFFNFLLPSPEYLYF